MKLAMSAKWRRLRRPRVDGCEDLSIAGRRRHIYEYSADKLAATIIGSTTAHDWNGSREALKAASCPDRAEWGN